MDDMLNHLGVTITIGDEVVATDFDSLDSGQLITDTLPEVVWTVPDDDRRNVAICTMVASAEAFSTYFKMFDLPDLFDQRRHLTEPTPVRIVITATTGDGSSLVVYDKLILAWYQEGGVNTATAVEGPTTTLISEKVFPNRAVLDVMFKNFSPRVQKQVVAGSMAHSLLAASLIRAGREQGSATDLGEVLLSDEQFGAANPAWGGILDDAAEDAKREILDGLDELERFANENTSDDS